MPNITRPGFWTTTWILSLASRKSPSVPRDILPSISSAGAVIIFAIEYVAPGPGRSGEGRQLSLTVSPSLTPAVVIAVDLIFFFPFLKTPPFALSGTVIACCAVQTDDDSGRPSAVTA